MSERGEFIAKCIVAVLLVFVSIGILLPLLGEARRSARGMQNTTQSRGIVQAMNNLASDNNGYFPGLNSAGEKVALSVEGRFQIMLEANAFDGRYIISPADTKKTVWTTGVVTSGNYSYAMLDISKSNERRNAWRAQINSMAVVLSDRNTGVSESLDDVMSIHTGNPGKWYGDIGWADGRGGIEKDCLVTTQYGKGPVHKNDNLFEQTGGDDAAMIHSGE